jgi:hypothetical protein
MALKPNDARKFDGTFGNAKAIVAWASDPRVECGASPDTPDDGPGGLQIVSEKDGAPFFTTVNPTDWLIRRDGKFSSLSDEQVSTLFPELKQPAA